MSDRIARDNKLNLRIKRDLNITDYPSLTGKPSINGVELVDDKSFEELGVENLTNFEILAIYKRVFQS